MNWFSKSKPKPIAEPERIRPQIITKPMPMIRGKLLVQDANSEEHMASLPKGYKIVALTAVIAVPADEPLMANGKLHDVFGALVTADPMPLNMPFVQLHVVGTDNVVDQIKGKGLGEAFALPIWKF